MMRFLPMLLLLALGINALAVTLTFSPTATVEGEEILLGEIAKVTDAGDAQARLQAVTLGVSPQSGQQRMLTPAMIRVRLRSFGFDPDAITLDCPPTIQISRLTTNVPGETLVESAREWLLQRMAPAANEKLELEATRTPSAIQVPTGAVTWDCAPAGMEVGNLRHVTVTVLVDGKSAWRGMISFKVRRSAEVLVLRSALQRGDALSEAAVLREWRDISSLSGTPLREVADLTGKRTVTSLAQGTVLTTAHLELTPLVKRNEAVHVQAHCGLFLVSAIAIAQEDGVAGAVIRVRNPDSKQEYTARVVSTGLLELLQ